MSKREVPHRAVITFDIDIRAMNLDGSLDTSCVSNERLSKYNIGKKAKVVISGVSEADCMKNVKRRLEKINE